LSWGAVVAVFPGGDGDKYDEMKAGKRFMRDLDGVADFTTIQRNCGGESAAWAWPSGMVGN